MKLRQQRGRCFIVQPENIVDRLFVSSYNTRLCTILLKCMKFSELDRSFNIRYDRYLVEEYDTCYHILESIWENIK